MNFRSIVKSIDSLPSLSDLSIIVRHLYENGAENVNINKLTIAIESDSVLTANMLKMINSPLYGLSKQVSSIKQAIVLLGTEMVYGIVIKFSIESTLIANLRPYGVSNDEFNTISRVQSKLTYEWLLKIDKNNAQFLGSLALIMESGKLVVAQEIAHSGNIKDFLEGLKASDSIIEYENRMFGTSSYYVSALLFEHWHFDASYVDMLKGLDFEHDEGEQYNRYIDILDVVRTVVNVKAMFTPESIESAADLVYETGLDIDEFLSVVDSVKEVYLKARL